VCSVKRLKSSSLLVTGPSEDEDFFHGYWVDCWLVLIHVRREHHWMDLNERKATMRTYWLGLWRKSHWHQLQSQLAESRSSLSLICYSSTLKGEGE
jgi:hypothetical protein